MSTHLCALKWVLVGESTWSQCFILGRFGTAVGIEYQLSSVRYLICLKVVLLDEADVFLEERGLADLQRNAFVSGMLRSDRMSSSSASRAHETDLPP